MSAYNEYKESAIFQEINESDFTGSEYDVVRNDLEKACDTISESLYKVTDEDTMDDLRGQLQMLRYAVKHLARVYPQYKYRYVVTGESHVHGDVVEMEIVATHQEKVKFFFHTTYPHTKYRITSIEQVG